MVFCSMSYIFCAMLSGLSACTNVFVIVLQTAGLRVCVIACFELSMYYYVFWN
jgi:hypothetical protein